MNCAKVLFSYIKNNFTPINLTLFENRLDVITSSHHIAKVKQNSTFIRMEPPDHLHGMKVLDRDAFKKTVSFSCLIITKESIEDVSKLVKKYFPKVLALKVLQETECGNTKILIDPCKISSWNDFDENTQENLKKLNVKEGNFCKVSIGLEYKNWSAETLIKAVLPKNEPPLTSYSIIGHIIHLNIHQHLLEYKNVIGEILLDKVVRARTVVYKKHFIDNIYRNFEMEVICGENNFITSVRENECVFELDFSRVYWNPRLSTEHQRIVDIVKGRNVLFDVFAGIGPFAIPAAKKGCTVYANDLNPESIKWLEHNIKLNKKAQNYIKTFNKDGTEFIMKDLKENLIKIWEDEYFNGSVHVVMNLPAIAPTFIKYFKGLISTKDLATLDADKIKKCLPVIHCYYFVSEESCRKTVFEKDSLMSLTDVEHSLHFVRQVSTTSSMIRITFTLPFDYLVGGGEVQEPLPKRICME